MKFASKATQPTLSKYNRGTRLAAVLGQAIAFALTLTAVFGQAASGQESPAPVAMHSEPDVERFPGEQWLHYADVKDAGFSPAGLARAKKFWQKRDSSAFMAVSGGAVVAAWGDVDRRFMCHSIRKSFLSALYGVYKDQIDLQLSLADLGIDDEPPLTESEKRVRIVDLISSRSGIYHEAAAEPAAMSSNRPARGSHPPGSHWWYNNWDFNAAGTVFERLTGEGIFEAFGEKIARPIGMQDFRISDGFYHHELEKSVHPGYMLRLSTRDLARFGLLFARDGQWQGEQIISEAWVALSTQPHSEVDMGAKYGSGYGYMWWIEDDGSFTARGSGGHILAVYPQRDLVMVVRADTFHDRFMPTRASMRLFDLVLEASGGDPMATAKWAPSSTAEEKNRASHNLTAQQLENYSIEIDMPSGRRVVVTGTGGVLSLDYGYGTFRLWPESARAEGATRFIAEDSEDPVLFDLTADGRVSRIWTEQLCYLEAAAAVEQGDFETVVTWVGHAVDKFPDSARAHFNLARALHGTGTSAQAMPHLRRALELDSRHRGASQLLWRLQWLRFRWWIFAGVMTFMTFGAWIVIRRRRAPRRLK